jgi:hypothetical protein
VKFQPGQSGNAGGRPKGDAWFRKLCRRRTMRALKALDAALKDEHFRVSAAKALLEFGWGKAPAVVVLPEDGDGTGVPSAEEAARAAEELRALNGTH